MRNGKRIHTVKIERLRDDGQPIGTPESGVIWENYGIRAEAEITIPVSSTDSLVQHITSGGLWELDCAWDDPYLKEVEQEQLDELGQQLHAIGFSKRAISAAFRTVQHD